MFFRQVHDEGLAQSSYLLACEVRGEALVVDPRRDIDVYIDVAARNDLRITGVAETHIHADYLSGGRELAAAVGAPLIVSGEGDDREGYLARQPDVTVRLVRDGDAINVGDIRVRVRRTPGHTPEHICFEICDAGQTSPMMLLTGDFFFVGDLGRPDLLEQALGKAGSAETSARAMFASLRSALRELPDFVALWPGHGAGSACGKALAAIPSTTLGYERRFAWWSGFAERNDESGFVHALLAGQTDAPSYFARMKHDNRGFTPLLRGLPNPPRLDAAGVRRALADGAVLIDTRPRDEFCKAHVRGAISLPDKPSFSARSAWFLSPEKPLVLQAKPERVNQLVRELVRVGLDKVVGYVPDATTPDFTMEPLPQFSPQEVERRWSSDESLVLDVRQHSEFARGHIPHALHVSAGSLVASLADIPRSRQLVVMCAGGDRSVAAASVLAAAGFPDVANLPGGFDEWAALGLPTELDSPISSRV